MKLAALDLGSNSFHLLVAEGLPNGTLRKVGSGKDVLRLGSVVEEHGELTPEAFDRALASASRLRALASELGATRLSAVATSALRDARNGRTFLEACRRQLGLDVALLSGDDEAYLAYRGAQSAHPGSPGRTLVADVGGGSLELAAGHADRCEVVATLPLGYLRLTSQLSKSGTAGFRELAAHVRMECEKFRFLLGRCDTLLLSGGTARAVGQLLKSSSQEQLSPAVCALVARMTPRELTACGVDERRVDTLGAGAAVLAGLLSAFEAHQVYVSSGGLREGVIQRELERLAGVHHWSASSKMRFCFAV